MNDYFMLLCQSPFDQEPALLSYYPDELVNGDLRSWKSCKQFIETPPTPIAITIDVGESGLVLELYDATIALMSRRLADVLKTSGVSTIDFYDAVIDDLETGQRHTSHVAFNIHERRAIADSDKSVYQAQEGPMISVDFDSLVLDNSKTDGTLLFRLAESVNGIVVHASVRQLIEAAGITTLTFLSPDEWVG